MISLRVPKYICALMVGLLGACSEDPVAADQGTDATSGTASDTAGAETAEPEAESDGESESDSDTNGESESETGTPADLPEEPEEPLYTGDPLPEAPPGDWNWVDIPGAKCIDGSPAGIGVRYGISDELAIFFEGGGGCFNAATCALFYASFANFDQLTFDLIWQTTVLQGGLFSTTNADNPLRDWNFIYVPYCTGDVHAGAAPDTPVPGFALGAPQQFVGYSNVHEFLDRIVPTFKDTSHVLVTGISAGGFGAAFNYDRIADAFDGSMVTLIDDSGPPLMDPYLVPCLQQTWRDLFNLDATLPPDCPECFADNGGGVYNLAHYLAEKHADQTLGLISSEQDLVIRTFFGYGVQNQGGQECPPGIIELPMNGAYFEEGVYALRSELSAHDNWGTYLQGGTSHTSISFLSYYLTNVNGIRMVDWVANMLEGKTSHVSP
ncbi:pectin acetylesterase-family hydrolase [Enhygromyxa salina]|uniref:pectin acetylesterase-family hydrolase n=1 Tax=Enhygromyxa salina TaxID=215803 RepID=UPI0011BACB3B|nr:pectin acetylesterase-family hydrolase [Enhygromyxa salina]